MIVLKTRNLSIDPVRNRTQTQASATSNGIDKFLDLCIIKDKFVIFDK